MNDGKTPLQRFLDERGISSVQLERLLRERMSASGVRKTSTAPNRVQWYRWRSTESITRKNMVRVLWAVREAASDPTIRMDEIFDLDPTNEANWN
jgi:hypothetical protein